MNRAVFRIIETISCRTRLLIEKERWCKPVCFGAKCKILIRASFHLRRYFDTSHIIKKIFVQHSKVRTCTLLAPYYFIFPSWLVQTKLVIVGDCDNFLASKQSLKPSNYSYLVCHKTIIQVILIAQKNWKFNNHLFKNNQNLTQWAVTPFHLHFS